MPTTMNVSLPNALKVFVDEQVVRGGFGSTSDYVCRLIRDHQQKLAVEYLSGVIADGFASGLPVAVTKKYWTAKRKQLVR